MKLLFAIATLVALVCAISAQGPGQGPTPTDNLIRRGMILEQLVEKNLYLQRQEGRESLLGALEYKIVLIEELIADLRENPVQSPEQQHAVELQLWTLEILVIEELQSIETAAGSQSQGLSRLELIANANKLLKVANGALNQGLPRTNVVVRSVQNEKVQITVLIFKLIFNINPNLSQAEQLLVRHEQTLAKLVSRLVTA